MKPRIELAAALAAGTLAVAAVCGGAFRPVQWLVVGGLLVGVWIVAAWEDRASLESWEFVLLAMFSWAAASAVMVGAAPLASKETIVGWVIAWLMWRIGRGAGDPSRELALRALSVGAAVVALSVAWDAVGSRAIRVGGVFENPNLAAAVLIASLAAGSAVVRGRFLRWSWLFLIVAATLLTGSRAGLIAMVVAAAVLLPRGRLRVVGVVAAALSGVVVVGWRFFSQPDVLAWHRVSIWRAVLEIWSERPWTGVGPGCLVEAAGAARIAYPDQVGRYQFVASVAESTPLAVLVQLGVVGFLLAAIAAWLWIAAGRASGALSSPAFRAGLAAMTSFAVFHDVLTVPVILWWWAFALGCHAGRCRTAVGERGTQPGRGGRVGVCLVLVWLTAWGVIAPAAARWQLSAVPVSSSEVERLTRLEPWYDEPAAVFVDGMVADAKSWTWTSAAEALFWAREAVRVHPGLARRWADLGKVHIRVLTDLGGTVHDLEAARSALTKACELDPHLPWHWLERARLERVAGDHDAAVRFAQRALDNEPNTVRGWLMLSRLELERGNVDAARRAFSEAKARADLGRVPGLTKYEYELVAMPGDVAAVLEERLGGG